MEIRRALRAVFVGDEQRDFAGGESTLENPSNDLVTALTSLEGSPGSLYIGPGGRTASGKAITPSRALRMIALYACVRVIAEDVGALPLHTFTKTTDSAGRRVRERLHEEDDARARVLGEEPNPEITAQTLWELLTGHALLWGNGYGNLVFDNAGEVAEIWPLPPDVTAPFRPDRGPLAGQLLYGTQLPNGETRILFPEEVLHIRAFGTGDVGISPIGIARQAVGIAVAAEEYAGRFWQNDATPGSVYVTTDKPINDVEYDRARRRFEARHRGIENAHLMAFLDNGAKLASVGVPPEDAQFIETRKFQVRELARLYRVPPYKIADLEAGSVSYASVEVQQIDYLQTSLNPWLRRIEGAIKRRVFATSRDRSAGLFAEFVRAAILQGDFKSTVQALSVAVNAQIITLNEARERLNLAPRDGGDVLAAAPSPTMSGAHTVTPGADAEPEDEGADAESGTTGD